MTHSVVSGLLLLQCGISSGVQKIQENSLVFWRWYDAPPLENVLLEAHSRVAKYTIIWLEAAKKQGKQPGWFALITHVLWNDTQLCGNHLTTVSRLRSATHAMPRWTWTRRGWGWPGNCAVGGRRWMRRGMLPPARASARAHDVYVTLKIPPTSSLPSIGSLASNADLFQAGSILFYKNHWRINNY